MCREPTDQTQHERARQYALCTIALRYDRLGAGAEGVFDQALTNGLAAIVAHSWPGRESNQRRRVLSASDLLKVIEERGKAAADGVVRVLHDPAGPEYGTGLFADLFPNFTSVRVSVLRAAISATQIIRHARDTSQDTSAALTEDHVEALVDLDYHPALRAIAPRMQTDYELGVEAVDRAAQHRAAEYLDLLDGEEYQRRAAIDYDARYRDEETGVEECPVCNNVSLVASAWDGLLAEVGIGQCVVCGYIRAAMVAEEIASERQYRRALDRRD